VYGRTRRDPALREARALNTIQNLDYVANNRPILSHTKCF
jgi:hypothetical protein